MKLSLWQQFASNHSNDFAIVGQFKSVDEATAAADELKTILKTIHDWYDAHPAAEVPRYENHQYIPTEIEQRIASHYDLQWDRFHEWILDHSSPEIYMLTLDQYVFLDSPQTWSGYEPFDALLRKLGAQVNAENEMGEKRIYVNLMVLAPSVEIAASLASAIKQYLEVNYRYMYRYRDPGNYDPNLPEPPPPWVLYAPNKPDASDDEILAAYDRQNIHFRRSEELNEQWRQLKRANVPDNDPRVKNINQAIEEHRTSLPDNIMHLGSWYSSSSLDTAPQVHGTYEKITVKDRRLRIDNLRFFELGKGLSALTGWLRSQGCEVKFEFHEDSYPDEDIS